MFHNKRKMESTLHLKHL